MDGPSPRRHPRWGSRLAALLLAGPAAACSGETASEAGPEPPPPSESLVPGPRDVRPGAHQRDTTEPLVLAGHATLTPSRLPVALARRVVRGEVRTWRVLDGSTARLRLVDGRGTPAAARRALRTVARDPRALALVPGSAMRPWVRAAVVAGVDPLRRPAAYPLRVAGPSPPTVTRLTVGGDVMLARGVTAAHPGDPTRALRPLARRLGQADLAVANLESTLSVAGAPTQGGDSFGAPGVLDGLRDLGLDALSLANNHTGDFGERALLATIAAFGGSGVRAFGAGRDRRAAGRAAVLVRNGVRFGFLGFNAIGETPAAAPGVAGALSVRMPPRTGPLDRGDLRHLLGLVRDLDRRVDVVVVLPHWGTQYTHVAGPVQRAVGRRVVAAGADLVVGGHPHWVQGLDRVGDAVLAHSLGNLVFDMDFMEQTMEGVLLEATFWGDRLVAVTLAPYRMDAGFSPRPVPGPDVLADVWRHSTGPFALR
ncbi:CapA family protein [Nocardioides guangzhouensis]|uniref:CapA family protein n=1 Tax=Nocardioides guangzhouensis TaxID=2497878 RepID=A0A4V1XZR7_9ACTN|nr:CapA family protein [Nocardioides guangzhouensis]RYP87689.1 CapA family protein [Nocardioides guangzhouensis]